MDWAAAQPKLGELLRTELQGIVQGVASDLAVGGFANHLANLAIIAAQSGDKSLLKECEDNLPWLAEYHRVKLVGSSWKIVGSLLSVVSGAAGAVATSWLRPEVGGA